MESSELKSKVDRYAELSRQQAQIKDELDQLKAIFEKQAEQDLKNTKDKTVEYWGSSGSRITVQNADTIKPIAMTVLKDFFGRTVSDFIKSEVKESLNDTCKTFLANMVKGNYIQTDLSSEIEKITSDREAQTLLCKKLKGKYKADKKTFMKILEVDEKTASEYAYLIEEVFAYQTIKMIMNASNFSGTLEDAVTQVKASLIVDETIKVTLETE